MSTNQISSRDSSDVAPALIVARHRPVTAVQGATCTTLRIARVNSGGCVQTVVDV